MSSPSLSSALREMAGTLCGEYPRVKIALTALGSELPVGEMLAAADSVRDRLTPVIIGPQGSAGLAHLYAENLADAHQIMEQQLASGAIDGAVTLHYNFSLGTTTVAQIHSVASGRSMVLASTTGSSDTRRVAALVKNAVAGLAVADALQIPHPTLGLLNIDGVAAAARVLQRLSQAGLAIDFAESARADGGVLMRGNDLIRATPDIMVCDTLTGNLLIKLWSAGQSGGDVETTGSGYGIGLGPHQQSVTGIISRASGPASIRGAMLFCALMAQRRVLDCWKNRWQQAVQAGIESLLHPPEAPLSTPSQGAITCPAKTMVNDEINGIDILQLEQAQRCLWQQGIYAETGMGCTGPVLMIHHQRRADALACLHTFLN